MTNNIFNIFDNIISLINSQSYDYCLSVLLDFNIDNLSEFELVKYYELLGDVYMYNEKFNEASNSFRISIDKYKLLDKNIINNFNFDTDLLKRKFTMAEAHLINEMIYDGEVYQLAWGTHTENQINGTWKAPDRIYKEYPFLDNEQDEFFQRIERNREIGILRKKQRKRNKKPQKISFLLDNNETYHGIVYVSCGRKCSCAVSCSGHLYMWGCGSCGVLGTCDTNDKTNPYLIKYYFKESPLSDDKIHSLFSPNIKKEEFNNEEKIETTYYLNDNKTIRKVIQTPQVKERSFIIDGSLLLNNIRVIQVAFGYEHTLVLSECGKVFSCGKNSYGQLGRGNESTVSNPFMVQLLNLSNIIQVSAGWYHSIALTNSGFLYVWGRYEKGALGITTLQDNNVLEPYLLNEFNHKVRQVECGMNHTLVLTIDGIVFSCGDDYYGQLGRIINKKNDKYFTIVQELENKEIRQIAAGSNHSIALSIYGTVFTWGYGKYGQLGYGHGNDYSIPDVIPSLKKKNIYIRSIFASGDKSACISNNGVIYTFGYGSLNTTLDYNPIENHHNELKDDIVTLSVGLFHLSVIKGKRESTISSEFKKLLNNSKYSDIEFIIENNTYKAHKVILLRASKYFNIIFEQYSKDNDKTKVYLDNITYSIFSLIMYYCYTNRVVVNLDNVYKVLDAGNFFQLHALVQLCENIIHENAVYASNTLPLGFTAAFENPHFYASDIILKVSSIKDVFYCHKVILTLRCEYFQTMFESSFVESSSKEIEIHTNVSYNVYYSLLHYIYMGYLSDIIKLSEEEYYDLLTISEEYQLPQLKDECSKYLQSKINLSNVIYLIQFAELYNLEDIFNSCISFIRIPKVTKYLKDKGSIDELSENIIDILDLPPTSYWESIFNGCFMEYYTKLCS